MIEQLIVAVPKAIVDRSHLDKNKLIDFERVTGIKKTRRYEGTTTEMILRALDASSLDVEGIDAVIVVTQSPDRLSPCMAVEIHNHLKLPKSALAFDINQACSGWITGLRVSATFSRPLLICADRLRYNKTPLEGLIFSDSVSITKLNRCGEYTPSEFYTDGSFSNKIYCGLNGEMDMDGAFVFDFVTGTLPPMIRSFQESFPCDVLVPHQANLSMNKILASRSGFKNNWIESIEEYGNQSMNSIPTAIVLNESKILYNNLLLCGFGAGMSVALMKIRWPKESISTLVEI
jgi:3-oxoacyl-[acyl-carrier-protein] synthase-3